MLLIPAIDLQNGKCVRLRQGDMRAPTEYSHDPLATAARWIEAGARRLHIVDLDGAAAGRPVNLDLIREIVAAFPAVPVQVGGGIRDENTVETYLESGVRYVMLGTRAVNAPHFVSGLCSEFPGHIIVALDVRGGHIAVDGWSRLSGHNVTDLVQRFEDDGVEAIVYTDIGRDGMLEGINVDATVALAEGVRIPVIASGGVRGLDDIRRLCAVADAGIDGVITGRAIYEGALDLRAGQELADRLAGH